MINSRHLLFCAASLWLQISFTPGPSLGQEDVFAGFAERVESERKAWKAPGLAIAVVHKDEVAFIGGFGRRHINKEAPVDEDTLFHVASTTKAFTAAALGLLVEEGKLKWDDKVVDHLPQFRVDDPYVTRELTITDLLCHRSGVQNTNFLWARGFSSKGFLRRIVHVEQSSSLRSKFEYNNGMYIVAGKVIEAVSGMSFTDFVRKRLFEPLGMQRTTGPLEEVAKRDNVAISHEKVDGAMTPIGLTDRYDAGAAGLFYSSVSDYVNWLRIWLNDGKLGDQVILDKSTIQAAFTPKMIIPEPPYPAAKAAKADLYAYGLGWFLQQYRGRRVNMHTGSLDGTSAIVGLMPQEKLGVVVFINGDHVELRHALMYETFDRVLGGSQRDWSSELRTLYDSIEKKAAKQREERIAKVESDVSSVLPLAEYAGLYRHSSFGLFRVVLQENQLFVNAPPLLRFSLEPAGGHKFFGYRIRKGLEKIDARKRDGPATIAFELDAENRPSRLVIGGARFERVTRKKKSD